MSVETQAEKPNPFGAKKVTQAEVMQYVNHQLGPIRMNLQSVANALDVLYGFLAEVGINGVKVTQAEIIAFVEAKRAENEKKKPVNGAIAAGQENNPPNGPKSN